MTASYQLTPGVWVMTPDGPGEVIQVIQGNRMNVLGQWVRLVLVQVSLEDGRQRRFKPEDLADLEEEAS